jgi:hypothetical protein
MTGLGWKADIRAAIEKEWSTPRLSHASHIAAEPGFVSNFPSPCFVWRRREPTARPQAVSMNGIIGMAAPQPALSEQMHLIAK